MENRQETINLNPDNLKKSGFKTRSFNWFWTGYFVALGAWLISYAVWNILTYGLIFNPPIPIIMIVIGLQAVYTVFTMLWSEVEDQGDALCLRFGPLKSCIGRPVMIPFDQIKLYREPKTFKERRCGFRGSPFASLLECNKRTLHIEFKSQVKDCGCSYSKMSIPVATVDYDEFVRMMDNKFGVETKAEATI